MEKIFLLLYFILLFVSLFLGDGKQPLVDVFFSGGVLVLFFLFHHVKIPILAPSKKIRLLFVLVIVGTFFSLIYSQSIGLSIFWYIRLLFGVCIFYLFYSLSSSKVAHTYKAFLVGFIFLSVASSIVVSVFFKDSLWLPKMNLLVTNYGHNHLADLLLFALPLTTGVVFFGILVTLLFTFARGAWAPAVLSFYNKKYAVLFGAFLVVVLMFYLKPVSPINQRIQYWQQATYAIQEHPFVGYGPGTFSLVSRKLQQNLNNYSWYAHGFAVQTIAESGMIGSLPLFALVIYLLVQIAKLVRLHLNLAGLFIGLVGTLFYSFYEFNLDFLVVWALFWSGAGVLLGVEKRNAEKNTPIELGVALVFIFIFYISNVISFATIKKYPKISFYVAPYVETNALEYIEKGNDAEKIINFLHKQSPMILYELAKASRENPNNPNTLEYYRRMVYADPQNKAYLSDYLGYLAQNLPPEQVGKSLIALFKHVGFRLGDHSLFALPNIQSQLGVVLINIYKTHNPRWSESYTSIAYVLGVELLPTHPDTTEQLWLFARDIYPDIGFIHVDLASFYEFVKRDHEKALRILSDCMKINSPKKQCEEQLGNDLMPPGEFVNLFI